MPSLEVATVGGDVAATGTLTITNPSSSQAIRWLEFGVEGPETYNPATALLLDSDSLVTSGFAGTQSTTTGAYDPNASGNSVISTSIFSSPQAVCGTGVQSHVGTFRVKARVGNGSAPTGIYWRLSWRVGDSAYGTNDPVTTTIPGWSLLDLGTITIPRALAGTQSWDGRVEAYKPGSTDVVVIDYLVLIPTGAGHGVARAAYNYTPGVVTGYDSFVGTTAGNALATRAAPAGGSWATSGDATDWVFADNFNPGAADGIESISRGVSTAETNGRFAILGSSALTDSQVDVRGLIYGIATKIEQSVILRWTDASNHLRLVIPSPTGGNVKIEQVVAGTVTMLAESSWQRTQRTPYRFRFIAFSTGRVIGQVISDGGGVLTELQGSSSAVATGGTLETGKPGLRDQSTAISNALRYLTEFAVSTPAPEPVVVYPGRTIEISSTDVVRQDATGVTTGRPRSYRGSRFTLEPGTSRVCVLAHYNDLETTTYDPATVPLRAQVEYSPRGLVVPR